MTVVKQRRFFVKKDLLIIAAVFAVALAAFFAKYAFASPQTCPQAEIYCDTKIVKTVALTPELNEIFTVPGRPQVKIQVLGGKIRFYSSTCRDKICIRAGFLSQPGESAACLPNKVAIKIVSAGNNSSTGADTYAT